MDRQHWIFSTIAASLLIDFPSFSDNVNKAFHPIVLYSETFHEGVEILNGKVDKKNNYTNKAQQWLHNALANKARNDQRFKETIMKINIVCPKRNDNFNKYAKSEHALENYCKDYSNSLFNKTLSGSNEHPLDNLYSWITDIDSHWNTLPKENKLGILPSAMTLKCGMVLQKYLL